MASKSDSTAPLRPAEPAVGFEVFTVDGMPAGAVREIAGGFMLIDAPLRPDFWLPLADATNVEGRAITLAYPREALEQHKHSGPAPSPGEYAPAGVDPVLLDEEEQRAQRALMERELAEQRRHLAERTTGPAAGVAEESERAWPCSGATCARFIAAVVAVAALLLGIRTWRKRRRREPESESPTP